MASRTKKDKKKYFYAVGRRKEATAVVRLYQGKGATTVNGIPIADYFPGKISKFHFERPFELTKNLGKFYALIQVRGGGKKGQLGAVSLAFSRALEKVDKEKNRPILKKENLLTVDARVRERRKVGQMGRARKKKQSPKR